MASNRLSDQDAWNFFYDLFGGNEYACAGACGNMMWETGLYTDNAENKWNEKTGHSDEWLTDRINNNLTGTCNCIILFSAVNFRYFNAEFLVQSSENTSKNNTGVCSLLVYLHSAVTAKQSVNGYLHKLHTL